MLHISHINTKSDMIVSPDLIVGFVNGTGTDEDSLRPRVTVYLLGFDRASLVPAFQGETVRIWACKCSPSYDLS